MEGKLDQPPAHLGFLGRLYNYRGFIFAFAAASFYAFSSILVSSLSGDISSTMTAFIRMLISMFPALIVLCYGGIPILPSSRKEFLFHCVNTVIGLVVMCMQYFAYQNMPPADACAIINSYAAFSGLFGRLFLKEAFGFFEAFIVIFTIMGVVLVSRPQFIFGLTDLGEESEIKRGPVPPLVALACAIFMALLLVVHRTMGKQDIHAMKATFYNSVISCILLVGPITLLRQWTLPDTYKGRSFAIMAGLFAFLGYVFMYLASSIENVVYVSLILLNDVYLVLILGVVFVGYKPHWLSAIGITLIVGSSAVLSVKKIVNVKKENNKEDKEKHQEEEVKESGCISSLDNKSQYHLLGKTTSV
ncbi:Solute carrier family 35 member G1 [Holothuria leucospilota]|uniref:Solute carrier family 35 member G1 n=1 Tax=Holothuria leucospilota TaxID=206669 RepID=A0A9Q0YDW2_HOLLE|nr:Solute carrier family 35 member G1 [Holothuria leucospilota]